MQKCLKTSVLSEPNFVFFKKCLFDLKIVKILTFIKLFNISVVFTENFYY